MVSKLIPLLVLLGGVSSDRLRFHLENLVDRNISACDDFYHHACSQSVDPGEFFYPRVTKIYREAIEKFTNGSDKNSPISYDLELVDKHQLALKQEDNNYAQLARERCKNDTNCYADDLTFYLQPNYEVSIEENATLEEKIHSYIAGTSSTIDKLIRLLNKSEIYQLLKIEGLGEPIGFHKAIQSRMHIIEFMKSNNTISDFHEISEISETMKKRMIEYIKKSPWPNPLQLKELLEKVESIQIYHDFDDLDKNITLLQKLNRDMNEHYFKFNRKSGVHDLDILFGVMYAYDTLKENCSPEITSVIERVGQNFGFNAFYNVEMNTVTMLAPLMYKPTLCTEIIQEPIVTYYVLGHELYHSLFNRIDHHLINMYGHRSTCLADHYENSCSKFARGECMSGMHTIYEDGSDIESFRLLYGILQDRYAHELHNPIDGMDTTIEQAYFYYAASSWCDRTNDRPEWLALMDRHSANNIRINAAFSLMPEFTRAFGCKAEDPMFVAEENSCKIFGPNS